MKRYLVIKIERKTLIYSLAIGLIVWSCYDVISETFTMISYYPSPVGIYKKLTTTAKTLLAKDSGEVGVGTDNPQGKFHVEGSGTVLFNTTGNVGIGTLSPQSKLDLRGQLTVSKGVQIGDSNKQTAGNIRFTGSDFEGYDGAEWKSLTGTSGTTEKDCTKANGSWSGAQKVCYFSSCPTGWAESGNYGSTRSRTCGSRGQCTSSCTTGSHTRANGAVETCTHSAGSTYLMYPGALNPNYRNRTGCMPRTAICTATITERGCVKN